ncbi:MAG: cytochrome c3 family protein [Acidobacteriota bacterium]
MKKNTTLTVIAAMLAMAILFLVGDLGSTHSRAQKADPPTIPEVITLGKDAKLGTVTFNHLKHVDGTYKSDPASPITCTTCHHTARSAEEMAKTPAMKTAWPADRTTTLTLDLFKKDPTAAGVASCRDCHARTGDKPKLIAAIPEIKPEGAATAITLNNQQAFHRTCTGCHADVKKNVPLTKAPQPMQCMMCHKKTAA